MVDVRALPGPPFPHCLRVRPSLFLPKDPPRRSRSLGRGKVNGERVVGMGKGRADLGERREGGRSGGSWPRNFYFGPPPFLTLTEGGAAGTAALDAVAQPAVAGQATRRWREGGRKVGERWQVMRKTGGGGKRVG